MKEQERKFLNEVKEAIDEWSYDYDTYNEDGRFCIGITIDLDDWKEDCDVIWETLENVCADWGAAIDSSLNVYGIAVELN